MIELLWDIDGTLVGENLDNARDNYEASLKYLPESWRDYHKNHVITTTIDNAQDHHLVLPGVLEMLRYFSIHLKEKVRISFFSKGTKERNELLCKELMQKVARDAGVDFDSIDYKVYSRDHCVTLSHYSELHPCSGNNPHIPKGCEYWSVANGEKVLSKKVLSKLFDNTSNVILIDDQYYNFINSETANHLKAVWCSDFSGYDLKNFRQKELSQEEEFLENRKFLLKRLFYEVNQAFYITGLLLAMIRRCEQLKISASEALESLQLCPYSNKYKQALYLRPIFHRYELRYFEEGFLALQAMNPSLELFTPYPHCALEVLSCQKEYVFINDNLRQATAGRYSEKVYDLIHEYHDTLNVCRDLRKQGFFNTKKTIEKEENTANAIENDEDVVIATEKDENKSRYSKCVLL